MGTVWKVVGANAAVFMTTSGAPLRKDTRPKWLWVTTTSNGLPPTWANAVWMWCSRAACTAAVVQPGSGRTRAAVALLVWLLPAAPPSSRYAPPPSSTTPAATAATSPRRDLRWGGTVAGPRDGKVAGPRGGSDTGARGSPRGRYSCSKSPIGSVRPGPAGPTPCTRPTWVGGPPSAG